MGVEEKRFRDKIIASMIILILNEIITPLVLKSGHSISIGAYIFVRYFIVILMLYFAVVYVKDKLKGIENRYY